MADMMLSALKCMCSFIVLISKLMFWTRFIDGKIEASTDKVGCWRSHICPCRMELQWKILSCDLTVILWVFHSGFLLWCDFCSYSFILHNSLLLYGLPLFILYFQLILAILFKPKYWERHCAIQLATFIFEGCLFIFTTMIICFLEFSCTVIFTKLRKIAIESY